jgi:hypothetical protein
VYVAVLLVPTGVVTETWTSQGSEAAIQKRGGVIAVTCVGELTTKLAAGVGPKSTIVASVKSVPVMTTDVPPSECPATGERLVIVGNAV